MYILKIIIKHINLGMNSLVIASIPYKNSIIAIMTITIIIFHPISSEFYQSMQLTSPLLI